MPKYFTEHANRPLVIDKSVEWDEKQIIISKTDVYGSITDVNDIFVKVSGYSKNELLGKAHSVIRHPDMPKIIFKVLWSNLKKGENFYGIVKNLAKSGEYYWVLTDFDIIKNSSGKVTAYQAKRVSIPNKVIINEVEPLYKRLLKLEEFYGADAGENYLNGFLEKEGQSYVEYIHNILTKHATANPFEQVLPIGKESSKSFLRRLFGN